MNKLAIITVGKTHSGKTTFAKALEKELLNSVVIDQDNHAEFLNTYSESMRSTSILRTAITFDEVLSRQQAETNTGDIIAPSEDEADHLFVIKMPNEVPFVIREIVGFV